MWIKNGYQPNVSYISTACRMLEITDEAKVPEAMSGGFFLNDNEDESPTYHVMHHIGFLAIVEDLI